MRSNTTLRSPCMVWIKADLQAFPDYMWKITVKIPAHFVYIKAEEGGGTHEMMNKSRTLKLSISRETKGTDFWKIIQEKAYKRIEGALVEDWDEKCWHTRRSAGLVQNIPNEPRTT